MAAHDLNALHLVNLDHKVAAQKQTSCNVCTRPFGTFRRKHHCRICRQVVCKHCTLYKDVRVDSTVSITHVRVCMSCLVHSSTQRFRGHSRATQSRRSMTSDAQKVWVQDHLPSPAARPLFDLDGDELQFRSLTLDSCQHWKPKSDHTKADYQQSKLKSGHAQAIDDSKTLRRRKSLRERPRNVEWAHPWPRPPVSANEEDRLRALSALKVLDSESDELFGLICDFAKTRLTCPMAAVSFMDEHRQVIKSSVGLAHKMIPRKIAFCAYTVYASESMVVLDTLRDDRFQRNPLVAGAAGVRFYAAAPIIDLNSGFAVGSVFVLDTRPRKACDISVLKRLALAASQILPRINSAKGVRKLEMQEDNNAIDEAEQQLNRNIAQIHTDLVHYADQTKIQASKLETSISPETSATTSSMTSLGSSNQEHMAPPKQGKEDKSVSMARLSTTAVEQMEGLLMRLLTQNAETQQQLAMQQILLSAKLGEHTAQINKLMSDFDRLRAKFEAKVGTD